MTDSKTPFISQPCSRQISEAIEKLYALTQANVKLHWRYCTADIPVSEALDAEWNNWQVVQPNAKGHIAWSGGRQVLWLAQQFLIPQDLSGFPLTGLALRLVLTWWADSAQIFVNGKLVQEGDLFDCSTRVLLSPSVTPGEVITVILRLLSPGHDDGALVNSLCVYESTLEPGFVASELAVLHRYLEDASEKLEILAAAVSQIDWEALPDGQKFMRSLSTLREILGGMNRKDAKNAKEGGEGRGVAISLVGHAHLDLAWLWSVGETWVAAQRTFESVLGLQQEFPNLTFCHSTPALYVWIEQHRPDLFSAIQQQVAAGRWEVVGGMWVEPELNLISGESIVRQLLYGQRYVQEKFGQVSKVAWLPDTFGFCATLPQFLLSGGIEYFVTQKLRWNDTTEFPYGVFWWRSPDGSEIFSLMSAPIGEGIDPIKMSSYAFDWQKQTNLQDALWLPGVGDHGGGPTRDMLEVQQRWEKSPFFPHLEFTSTLNYLQQISGKLAEAQSSIPTWEDELYLEFHRGCYTTHADQKRFLRRTEGLLYHAELFASLATITTNATYPKDELESAWKKVLFNQFHDILPGTSIPQVFVEANTAWQEVEQVGEEILAKSLSAIASSISLPPPPQPDALPVIVFNSLNWQRSQVVTLNLPDSAQSWQIWASIGEKMPVQLGEASTLLFLAKSIPSLGYRVFWLCKQDEFSLNQQQESYFSSSIPGENATCQDTDSNNLKDWVLENEFLRVIVDGETGDLSSVFDKVNHREVINQPGGNQLQAFQDRGQYWDAWNIDPNYTQNALPPTELKSIQWVERGLVQTRLRVCASLGESEFCQDYLLEAESPVLKIVTTVDWQERHVLVKAAFPLTVTTDSATYEIPCGTIVRPTQPQTPQEKAKWEVSALRWADLSDNNYGVSLLNDCKYGYDAQPSQLRLTLLRSATWPDPEADQGKHQFTYALYPHSGTWQSAHTVRRGYELNIPLQAMVLPSVNQQNSSLPAVGQFLDLQAENLILMALKQSEDNPQQWILRCYECHGEEAQMQLKSDVGLAIAHPVDLLERPIDAAEVFPTGQSIRIQPWQIASFTLEDGKLRSYKKD